MTDGTINRQQALLIKLSEECGEVVQRVAKMLQYGAENRQAQDGVKLGTNKKRLTSEIQDVLGIIYMLENENFIDEIDLEFVKVRKPEKTETWLRHSKSLGIYNK